MPDDVHVLRLPEPVPGAWENLPESWPEEVVVDFPSVTALVARMQASFLASESGDRPATAEVTVSAAQASTGGRVVVPLPLRRPCEGCAGRGEVGEEGCAACEGAGHRVSVEPVQVFLPAGVLDGTGFRLHLGVLSGPQTTVDLRVRVL